MTIRFRLTDDKLYIKIRNWSLDDIDAIEELIAENQPRFVHVDLRKNQLFRKKFQGLGAYMDFDLHSLDMRNTELYPDDVVGLFYCLFSDLHLLDIRDNPKIGFEGADNLIEVLTYNTSIRNIRVDRHLTNYIKDAVLEADIATILDCNFPTLDKLGIPERFEKGGLHEGRAIEPELENYMQLIKKPHVMNNSIKALRFFVTKKCPKVSKWLHDENAIKIIENFTGLEIVNAMDIYPLAPTTKNRSELPEEAEIYVFAPAAQPSETQEASVIGAVIEQE